MKYLIKHTKSVSKLHTSNVMKEVKSELKKWGLDIQYTIDLLDIDEANEIFYETKSSWSFLTKRETKSIKSGVLNSQMKDGYDGVILFVDKGEAIETSTLRGQHSNGGWKGKTIGLMEIYSSPKKYVYRRKNSDGYHYSGTSNKSKGVYTQDVYVTLHEIGHDIGKRILSHTYKDLHNAILEGKFVEYMKDTIKQVNEALKPVQSESRIIEKPPIKYLCIHHTAVSRASGKNQLDAVNTYHQEKNWGTDRNPFYQSRPSTLGYYVGYNEFIDVDGTNTKTRAIGEETIANVGHNCDIESRCDTISLCIAMDGNRELLNDKQIPSLKRRIKSIQMAYPDIKVVFHWELQKSRTCAGTLFTHDYLQKRVLGIGVDQPDKVDAEKQEEIEKLQNQINILKKIIDTLMRLLKLKK